MLAQNEEPQWAIKERYSKQTLRNRCSIYGANGKITLSLPVKRIHGKDTIMSEALLSYEEPWQQIHWRSIKSAYGRSPYFEFYEDKIEAIYNKKQTHLLDFLIDCNVLILDILKMNHPKINQEAVNIAQQKRLDLLAHNQAYPEDTNYYQIFEDRHGFIPNLSVLDWVFHNGNKL